MDSSNTVKFYLKQIKQHITELQNHPDYFSDPYETILTNYLALESSHYKNKEVIDWSKNYAYRIIYEAPIHSLNWKELLNDIENINKLL